MHGQKMAKDSRDRAKDYCCLIQQYVILCVRLYMYLPNQCKVNCVLNFKADATSVNPRILL